VTLVVLLGLSFRDRLRRQGRPPQNNMKAAQGKERAAELAAAEADGAFAEAEHAAAA
jgi:hypothetical protein